MSSACVDYVPALCTHRPSLLPIECASEVSGVWFWLWFAKLRSREVAQTCPFRGRRSRNKVSVGEPAEGSLSFLHTHSVYRCRLVWLGSRSSVRLVACPSSAPRWHTLLRQPLASRRALSRLVSSLPPRVCASPFGVVLRALTQEIIQLLSMDILA